MSDDLTVRDRLLDAAVAAATVHGIAKLSVSDVARQARLSRQTLYKHFPSKEALVATAVAREAATIVSSVVAATAPFDDPREALEAGMLRALVLTREHPLLDRLLRTEPEALLPLLLADRSAVMASVRAAVGAIMATKVPWLDDTELRRLADLVSRLFVSYAVSAPDDPPEVVASLVATLAEGALHPVGSR